MNFTSWRSTMYSSDRHFNFLVSTSSSKGWKITNGAVTKRPSTMQKSANITKESPVSSTLSIQLTNASMIGRLWPKMWQFVKFAAKRCYQMRHCLNVESVDTEATSITWPNGSRSMKIVRISVALAYATDFVLLLYLLCFYYLKIILISTWVNIIVEVVLCSVVICNLLQPTWQLLHIFVGSVGLQGSKDMFVLFKGQLSEQFIAALFGIFDKQSHVVLNSLLCVLAWWAFLSS